MSWHWVIFSLTRQKGGWQHRLLHGLAMETCPVLSTLHPGLGNKLLSCCCWAHLTLSPLQPPTAVLGMGRAIQSTSQYQQSRGPPSHPGSPGSQADGGKHPLPPSPSLLAHRKPSVGQRRDVFPGAALLTLPRLLAPSPPRRTSVRFTAWQRGWG